jgi:N-methylhydantoinase A/oxoprolinase/acetone carboxylase beta subunit
LREGHALEGPAIVQEYSATTWVPPEWRVEVDAWGSLQLVPIGQRS